MGAGLGAAAGPLGTLISGGIQIAGAMRGSDQRKAEARKARAEYETTRANMQNFTFTNPFEGMENVAEDLTINQEAAQFQAQQTDQALANALSALTQSGGTSGGNAQAIINAALQSKQAVSADIARQEQANRMAAVNREARLQELQATGDLDLQTQQYTQNQELFTLASGRKRQSDIAQVQATKQLFGGIGQASEGLIGLAPSIGKGLKSIFGKKDGGDDVPFSGGFSISDRRLKKNIKLIGISPSGFNIYNFEYKNSKFGKGVFQGVMSDEVPSNAVIKHPDGYDRVDYSKIDVKFNKQ
tara:strand:- start:208 stop:1107 length:900 start_codon:yes stop_codon:yes gene_type:complete